MMNSEYRAALRWLASGDTGMSSEALLYAALSINNKDPFRNCNYPHDPDDLGRCLRLLKRLPWVKRGMSRLARRNKVWKALAKNWSEIHKLMASEVGIDWSKGRSAPQTFTEMSKIIDDARRQVTGKPSGQKDRRSATARSEPPPGFKYDWRVGRVVKEAR
jgi:hypothetical protein